MRGFRELDIGAPSQAEEQIGYKAFDATKAIISQDPTSGKDQYTVVKFNELLEDYIKAAQCSKRAFAQRAGLSREALRKYTTGERNPTNESLGKILRCLGIENKARGQRLRTALVEARGENSGSSKRSYGVGATAALTARTGPTETPEATLEKKVALLVETFFENADRPRVDWLEINIANEFRKILKGEN